jgi:sugar lactone lactonase YvrE
MKLSNTLHFAVVGLAACALLTACGGSGGGSAEATPPPPAPAITLVAENLGGYFFPGGIAVDASGTIYVGNTATRKIHKVTSAGVVSDLAGDPAAGFRYVDQLVFDKRGQVLYAVDRDYGMPSGALRKISLSGEASTVQLSTFATHGGNLNPGSYGNLPGSLALGPDGTLHAATMARGLPGSISGGPHIYYTAFRYLSWRTVEADGSGRPLWQQEVDYMKLGGWPDESTPSHLYPSDVSATGGVLGANLLGLAIDKSGNAYIADTDRHVIVKVTPAGVASIYAGAVNGEGSADGSNAQARFRKPTQLVFDQPGNLFVLDRGNSTVRKITPDGVVSTVIGVAGQDKTVVGDLPGSLGNPAGLAMDDGGRLYIAVDKGVLRVRLP